MKDVFGSRKRRDSQTAQTLVFFLLAWGSIMLLCGLAIDSGLLYLAKARMSRAVDGAALAAVGNFNRSSNPVSNRDEVALIMRNFAVANFTSLSSIATTGSTTPGGVPATSTQANGTTSTTYTYNFTDGTQDPNGQFRRFVQVVLTTGTGGAITSATCNARCPVQTYFIGYGYYFAGGKNYNYAKIGGYSGPSSLVDLKVSSSAIATRNPRLIMVVIDRSASMLQPGGGASGLPPAIVQFLDFFDTSSDNIGIVSFGSSARLEMPLTTNFLIAGTNVLIDAYETNDVGAAEPGEDPEANPLSPRYDPNYNSTGVRRLKFGGDTAADDGIRLGLESLMANAGFNDPDVIKYMVIFTDGKWNASRTLVAAPGYTNIVVAPPAVPIIDAYVSNSPSGANGSAGAWNASDLSQDTNIVPVPTLSPLPGYMTAIAATAATNDYGTEIEPAHANDTWLSADGTVTNEPFNHSGQIVGGTVGNVVTTTFLTNSGGVNYFTHTLDVWLQPGSVDYVYHNGAISNNGVYVSDFTNPTKHINVWLASPAGTLGDSNVLVVPGYIADGVVFDGLDLAYPDNSTIGPGLATYPSFRVDNYQDSSMWPDEGGTTNAAGLFVSTSFERQLMFRNYVNFLIGFYVFRPDEPIGPGYEPLITDQYPPGAPRARYGLGAYYPSAGFYFPFGGEYTNSLGYVTNAIGVDGDPTFGLQDPNSGSSSRHIAYSINMLSSNAAPEWYGELFYKSSSGGGTNTISTTTAASKIMQSADWQNGDSAFPFISNLGSISGLMVSEATHNSSIVGSPSVWRPSSFNGSNFPVAFSSIASRSSATGGYVTDGKGNYYENTMAYSGRPTHYFDFSKSKWVSIYDNHTLNTQFLQMGTWKAQEYAWHARALGVTIFTVGYGTLVSNDQCVLLAQIANSTNTFYNGGSSNVSFNPNQPIGEQFYATNATDISNDFYSVGQAINAALTQ